MSNEPTSARKLNQLLICRKRVEQSVVLMLVFGMHLTGCGGEWMAPERQSARSIQDAGTAHVAVLAVAPWRSIKNSLVPEFKLDSKTALDKAIPVSQQLVEKQLYDTFLEIGATSSLAHNKSAGKGDIDLEKIVEKLKGKLRAENSDPFLRYQVATTLFQEVALLEKYLNHAEFKKNYEPYLVRVQVALLPRRRNLPYDAYTNIAFYPRDLSTTSILGEDAPLYVVPIIASDNLEGSATLRLLETVNSLNFSLQKFLSGNVGEIGGGTRADRGRASSVVDLNALLTVARATNNTIRVRMGAMHQGAYRFAMIPRTHNITFLLLVKKNGISKIRVVTQTTFINSETGDKLESDPRRSRSELARQANELINGFGYVLQCGCVPLKDELEEPYKSLEFLRLLQLGQYDSVESCLQKKAKKDIEKAKKDIEKDGGPTACQIGEQKIDLRKIQVAEYERLTRLFTALFELEVESQTGKAEFDLLEEEPPKRKTFTQKAR